MRQLENILRFLWNTANNGISTQGMAFTLRSPSEHSFLRALVTKGRLIQPDGPSIGNSGDRYYCRASTPQHSYMLLTCSSMLIFQNTWSISWNNNPVLEPQRDPKIKHPSVLTSCPICHRQYSTFLHLSHTALPWNHPFSGWWSSLSNHLPLHSRHLTHKDRSSPLLKQ